MPVHSQPATPALLADALAALGTVVDRQPQTAVEADVLAGVERHLHLGQHVPLD